MNLRNWQKECIQKALSEFSNGKRHFLCLATPGAGKTVMASILAKKLIVSGQIDMVMCFSPSVVVAEDFKIELERQTGMLMNGRLGSIGLSVTYQSMLSLEADFWSLIKQHRVLVIFDEIHHCAGSGSPEEPINSNSWGEKVISNIQGQATYTVALTGTPWRSDQLPIVLADYDCKDGIVSCDHSYGLAQAIKDNVCRTPAFTIIDNDSVGYKHGNDETHFRSFEELLSNTKCSYQTLLESTEVIEYCLLQATQKLDQIRQSVSNAGGLVVSTSVQHASKIHEILMNRFGENAEIVTHKDKDALFKINAFKCNARKWIISVGMISEGTNIPRLQVCCYLTRVKTELYFRQVLGRVLRSNGKNGEVGHMITPAEPTLIEYANRIKKDIPKNNPIDIEEIKKKRIVNKKIASDLNIETHPTMKSIDISLGNAMKNYSNKEKYYLDNNWKTPMSINYIDKLQFLGEFKKKILKIRL